MIAQDRTALVIANFDYGERQLSSVKAESAVLAERLLKDLDQHDPLAELLA